MGEVFTHQSVYSGIIETGRNMDACLAVNKLEDSSGIQTFHLLTVQKTPVTRISSHQISMGCAFFWRSAIYASSVYQTAFTRQTIYLQCLVYRRSEDRSSKWHPRKMSYNSFHKLCNSYPVHRSAGNFVKYDGIVLDHYYRIYSLEWGR